MNLSHKKLVGHWRNDRRKMEFLLHDDGSAQTSIGDRPPYSGTWDFSSPRRLLVLAVVPLNDPEIDDEMNALELCYDIYTFMGNKFTAEEFDSEGIQEFRRL